MSHRIPITIVQPSKMKLFLIDLALILCSRRSFSDLIYSEVTDFFGPRSRITEIRDLQTYRTWSQSANSITKSVWCVWTVCGSLTDTDRLAISLRALSYPFLYSSSIRFRF